MSGRLQILRRDELGEIKTLGELGRGEGVGELSLLSGEPRLATPYALRDTELIRFSPESFHALIDRYPKALKTLTRTLIEKSIVAPHASTQRRASTRYFTLVPTGPSAPATAFAQALREELARSGPTLYLSAQELSTLGVLHDVARLPEGHPRWLRFSAWMEDEGPRHAYVVLETDATLTPWTRRAIRLADHTVPRRRRDGDARARAHRGRALGRPRPRPGARPPFARLGAPASHTRLPSGTQAWLSRRAFSHSGSSSKVKRKADERATRRTADRRRGAKRGTFARRPSSVHFGHPVPEMHSVSPRLIPFAATVLRSGTRYRSRVPSLNDFTPSI